MLVREIYASPERSYTVAEIEVEGKPARSVVAAGDLQGCSPGDRVEFSGEMVQHPRFGPQLRIRQLKWLPPAGKAGIRRFLCGASMEGIGEKLAERIVEKFGIDTLRVLDQEPERLAEVDGVGAGRQQSIAAAWRKCRDRSAADSFLAELGLGTAMIGRLRKVYGDEVASVIRTNPYVLERQVEGIGFRRADQIARRMKFPLDAPERVSAALATVLEQQCNGRGHVYAPREELVRVAAEMLELPAGPVEDRLAEAITSGELRSEDTDQGEVLYPPVLHSAEQEVAANLRRRAEHASNRLKLDPARAVEWVEPQLGFELTDDQRRALETLFRHRVSILTGGPGVGKTTIVRALADVFEAKGWNVALAAPTGRAARRLSESCRRDAATVHRLLKFNPQTRRFEFGRDHQLDLDVLLVDEASMLDLSLTRDLLRALPIDARLILIGDADQLPSVGPGDVLRSLVDSGEVAVARLTQILRQAEGSTIVQAAHTVLAGGEPVFQTEFGEGAFFVPRDDPIAAQRAVCELVAKRIPQRFGVDAFGDVQVLTPMNRGPLGTRELNRVLKTRLHGEDAARTVGRDPADPGWLTGDRVIQTRNNYDLEVFNGEIGRVVMERDEEGHTVVDFEDRRVKYTARAAEHLQLAYAITVHKSQGCEFPVVVLVLGMQHFVLLGRNLLYTAVTRARRLLVVVGAKGALMRAIEQGAREERRTLLPQRLRGELSTAPRLRQSRSDAATSGDQ